MKQLLCIFCFLNLFYAASAQIDVYIVPQLDGGVPINSHSGDGDKLKTRIASYQIQAALSGRIVFAEKIGLELGISQNHQTWNMRDKGFNSRNSGFDVYTTNKFNYYSLFGSLIYNHSLSEFRSLYISAGYSINNIGVGNYSESKLFVKNNEVIDVSSAYFLQTNSIHGEVGLQNPIGKNDLFVYSLKFSYGLDNMLSGSYKVSKEGSSISDVNYNSTGTFIGISLKYNFRVIHKPKRERPIKTDTIAPPPPKIKAPHVEVETKKEEKTKKRTEIPKTIAGRDVSVKRKITVGAKTVTIRVYDSGNVDGDTVSVYFNETTIIEKYELTKKPFVVTVELDEGKNIFTLHALNLGTIPPNTALITIDDGKKLVKLGLESTLKTSGTIEIDYYPEGTKK